MTYPVPSATMADMTLMPHEAREWTVDDLELLPDDGLQYELLDGVLLVSPAPVPRHQRAVLRLAVLLTAGCPAHMEAFVAPLDWQPDRRTSWQPDLLVVRKELIGEKNITENLMLAVEVLSPSTRRKDQVFKRSKYQDVGVGSFWIADPGRPSITCFDLVDGAYVQVAAAIGDQSVTLTLPFAVTVTPAALVS